MAWLSAAIDFAILISQTFTIHGYNLILQNLRRGRYSPPSNNSRAIKPQKQAKSGQNPTHRFLVANFLRSAIHSLDSSFPAASSFPQLFDDSETGVGYQHTLLAERVSDASAVLFSLILRPHSPGVNLAAHRTNY